MSYKIIYVVIFLNNSRSIIENVKLCFSMRSCSTVNVSVRENRRGIKTQKTPDTRHITKTNKTKRITQKIKTLRDRGTTKNYEGQGHHQKLWGTQAPPKNYEGQGHHQKTMRDRGTTKKLWGTREPPKNRSESRSLWKVCSSCFF